MDQKPLTTKKIGLVIQGPLMSIGKDGERAHIPKVVMGEAGFVRYDCTENIQKLIDDFGNLFDVIVVSTWDSEVKPEHKWSGATLVSMPDPGEVQREVYSGRSRNKYRQFTGIRHGLLEMEKIKPVDYVVRIRTDTYVDLKKVLNSFFAVEESGAYDVEMIGVPLTRPVDYFIHDFYFMARFDVLNEFCDAVLEFDMFEFISCVHREMVLKHAYVTCGNLIQVPPSAYFPYWPASGASRQTKKIFSYMFDHIFAPLDPEIFRTMLWRGTALSEQHVRQQLGAAYSISGLVNKTTNTKKTFTIPHFASIYWERYFEFLQATTGRRTALIDTVVITIGKLGWECWNILRKVVRDSHMTRIVYKLLG